jgi:hypothetical protein
MTQGLNRLEMISLSVICLTFFLGLLNVSALVSDSQITTTLTTHAANAALVLHLVFFLIALVYGLALVRDANTKKLFVSEVGTAKSRRKSVLLLKRKKKKQNKQSKKKKQSSNKVDYVKVKTKKKPVLPRGKPKTVPQPRSHRLSARPEEKNLPSAGNTMTLNASLKAPIQNFALPGTPEVSHD